MQHLDEGTIHAWLDGELPPAEREAAEAHVVTCAECAAAVAEARGFIAASSRILTALDSVPGGVLPVKDPVGTIGTGARRRFTLSRAWMAAAAVLVLSTVTVIARRPDQDDKLASAAFQNELKSMHEETQSELPAAGAPAASAAPAPQVKSPMNAPSQEPRAAAGGTVSGFADKSDARARVARKDVRQKKEVSDSPSGIAADATSPASRASAKPSATAAPSIAAPAPAERSFAREADSLAAKSAPQAPPPAAKMAQTPAPAPARFPDSLRTRTMILGSVVVTGAGTTTSNEKLGRALVDSSAIDTAPQVMSRNTFNNAGDTVVTTVYNVGGVAVSLIDRSAARDESLRVQVRGLARPSTARIREAAASINSITWSDSTGHTRTLRGALSREELERIRAALFGPTP
jgi:anti-sigma factor RsiW